MSDFKVGDRVTLVDPHISNEEYKGQIGVVVSPINSRSDFVDVKMPDGKVIGGSYAYRWKKAPSWPTNACREAFSEGQIVPLTDGGNGKVVRLTKREGWVIVYPYNSGSTAKQVSPKVFTSEDAAKGAIMGMPYYKDRIYWTAKIEWEE